jgi:hypothetical protein
MERQSIPRPNSDLDLHFFFSDPYIPSYKELTHLAPLVQFLSGFTLSLRRVLIMVNEAVTGTGWILEEPRIVPGYEERGAVVIKQGSDDRCAYIRLLLYRRVGY